MLETLILIAFDFGPKFSLGQVFITPNAMKEIPQHDIENALKRHIRGDWGDVCDQDRQENERSLQSGCRILSAYRASNGIKFWIITEANRSSSTVLLPEDY